MLRGALLAAAVALAGLTSATGTAPTCDATCQTGAVSLLLGRCASKRLPPACVDDLAAEASAFCSGFLSPVTVGQTTLVTTTQVESVTVTETATATATDTTISTTTTVTTISDVATETSTTVSTSTTTKFAIMLTSFAVERRGARHTACPKLSTPRLLRLAPAKVSSVCSLLGVIAPATTVTGTATSTAASTTTASTETATSVTTAAVVDVETTLVQTTTSVTTTTTTSAVAVATQIVDACGASRSFQGSGIVPGGHTILTTAADSASDCCRRCWANNNCVVSVYNAATGGLCRLAIKTQPVAGAPTNAQCPLGILPWLRSATATGPGDFMDGPCGIL